MVPSAFVQVETMPLTPSGKIDRQALLSLEIAHAAPKFRASLDPAMQRKRRLRTSGRRCWGSRLWVEDDFFEIGGYSLLAIRVMSRIRERMQVELPMSVFFDFPTVAGLAKEIVARQQPEMDHPDLAQLMAELDGISDEDVERLLAAELQAAK